MARFGGSTRVAANPIAAATLETIAQLVAVANQFVVLVGYNMNGKGNSNTEEPGEWDLMRQTSAGTSLAGTVEKDNDSLPETLQTTSRITFTVEPTLSGLLRSHTVHPQASLDIKDQFSREKIIGGGDRMALRALYLEAQNVGVTLDFEE